MQVSGSDLAGENLLQVFIKCRPGLYRMLSAIVDSQDVDDILQETYIRASSAADSHPILNFHAFFIRTARNLAFNHLATAYIRLTELQDFSLRDFALEASDLESQLEQLESILALLESVLGLPTQCRRAFVLKKIYGMSQKEIASFLAISQSTVEKHVAKGVQRCREMMGNMGHQFAY